MVRTDGYKEEEQYAFDAILDYGQAENGRWQYLVKWAGHHAPTWQPVSDLKGCDDDLWAFHEANPDKGKPPAWLKRRKPSPATATAATVAPPPTAAPTPPTAPPAAQRRSARNLKKMDNTQLRCIRCIPRNFRGEGGSVTGFACS